MSISVLQVIPNLGAGGAEQSCLDIVTGLCARGDRAIVVSAGGFRVEEVRSIGGEHYVQRVDSKNPARILSNAFWLADFIQRQQINLVHARSRAPAWSSWLASRMTGCPFITTFHARYEYSNPLKQAYNSVMAKADRVIAISQELAIHAKQAYGVEDDRLHLIYRGIDFDAFDPTRVSTESMFALRQSWGVAADKKIILMPGRLSPIKGHRLFIEALAPLLPAMDDVVAVIMGDDQGRTIYREELDRLIVEKGLQEKVLIVPHHPNMPVAYRLAQLVVVPSQVPEGFGRVPVEAMAMGLPVVASKLGALQETVLDNETGWLVPHDEPDAWRKAIMHGLELNAIQRQKIANIAAQRARTHFNVRHMISETLAVYDDLLLQHRKHA